MWEKEKAFAIQRLKREIEAGKVDIEILDIIELINAHKNYYTTSTCSGRIQVIDIDNLSSMRGKRIINKHSEISTQEILPLSFNNFLFLMAEPPIFHIVAKDLEAAKKLLEISHNIGFKRTGIRDVKNERFVVEVLSTEFLKIPLGKNGKLWFSNENLNEVVKISNALLKRGKNKLEKMRSELKKL